MHQAGVVNVTEGAQVAVEDFTGVPVRLQHLSYLKKFTLVGHEVFRPPTRPG